jgi:ankyrin repeat protein
MKQFLRVLIALCLSTAAQAKGKLDPLTEAAGAGELERVAKLLDEGAAVEGNGRFAPPLYYAATAGHIEVVRLLLQHGADINSQRFSSGRTALMGAALVGDAQIVKLLLDKEANPLLRGWMLHTALDTARRERHADVAQLLEPVTKSTVSAGELQQLNVQFLVILDALQHPSGKLMGMPGYLGCREKTTFKRNGKWQTLPKVAFLAVIDTWRLQAGEFQRARPRGDRVLPASFVVAVRGTTA